MIIAELSVRDLRCIEHCTVSPDPGLNLFLGANGSGKSSILEAVALLTSGRSFRAHYARPLVRIGMSAVGVRGTFRERDGAQRRIRYAYASGKSRSNLDGRRVESRVELSRAVPVVVSEPEGQRGALVSAGARRGVVDWTLFHVEPDYVSVYREYRRALDQRNRLLRERADRAQIRSWTESLAVRGEVVEGLRQRHLPGLRSELEIAVENLEAPPIEIGYSSGWVDGVGYREALERSVDLDMRRGFTSCGPHRADLELRTDGSDARLVLSRGEGKLVSVALHLAQTRYLSTTLGVPPVLLVDDLSAELDERNLGRVLGALEGLGGQVLATGVPSTGFERAGAVRRVFHVERGEVAQVV